MGIVTAGAKIGLIKKVFEFFFRHFSIVKKSETPARRPARVTTR